MKLTSGPLLITFVIALIMWVIYTMGLYIQLMDHHTETSPGLAAVWLILGFIVALTVIAIWDTKD